MGRVEHGFFFFLMELPPCFPKVNGKATCWKIGEEEKKIGIRFRGFCTHSINGYYVSLRDIKISAVIFLSGLEMCVKKCLSSNFRAKYEICCST